MSNESKTKWGDLHPELEPKPEEEAAPESRPVLKRTSKTPQE